MTEEENKKKDAIDDILEEFGSKGKHNTYEKYNFGTFFAKNNARINRKTKRKGG